MNALPFAAQPVQVIHQHTFYLRDLAARESVVFPKFDRSRRTLQIEDRLTAAPDHMHMSWPMIIRVDNYPHSAKPEDRGQPLSFYPNSQALGFFRAVLSCARVIFEWVEYLRLLRIRVNLKSK